MFSNSLADYIVSEINKDIKRLVSESNGKSDGSNLVAVDSFTYDGRLNVPNIEGYNFDDLIFSIESQFNTYQYNLLSMIRTYVVNMLFKELVLTSNKCKTSINTRENSFNIFSVLDLIEEKVCIFVSDIIFSVINIPEFHHRYNIVASDNVLSCDKFDIVKCDSVVTDLDMVIVPYSYLDISLSFDIVVKLLRVLNEEGLITVASYSKGVVKSLILEYHDKDYIDVSSEVTMIYRLSKDIDRGKILFYNFE